MLDKLLFLKDQWSRRYEELDQQYRDRLLKEEARRLYSLSPEAQAPEERRKGWYEDTYLEAFLSANDRFVEILNTDPRLQVLNRKIEQEERRLGILTDVAS